MIKLLMWNVRGMNTSSRQREVAKSIAGRNASICILVETKIKIHKKEKVLRRTFGGWNCFDNYEWHEKGRIWVLYKEVR